jgi:hypothetical protein
MKQFKTSHTFHRTPSVYDCETTARVQQKSRKLEHLIRRLKNTTGFHLHEPSPNWKP